jgi:DNA-binding beta-propeller fold protein YncE
MFKLKNNPRIVYLGLIVVLFAIILGMASFNLLQPDNADLVEAAPDREEGVASEAVNEPQPEAESLAEADLEQAEAEAAVVVQDEIDGPKFDHHGNPIREDPAYEKVVENGAAVEMTVENFLGVGGRGGQLAPEIFEGELALLKFRITEAETGQAMPELRPAVWMDLTEETEHEDEDAHSPAACREKVQGYLGGTLGARADINLNSYFVLAMNEDASISVIDPMVDVGGMTNLYAAIQLPKTGADWAMSGDQQHLFVTIPATDQVTVADLEQFWAIKQLKVGANPVRIAFQPDERYLWVGNDEAKTGQSGVTVIDPEALEMVTFIPTGAGHHELAFSADSRYAFVTNDEAGTLSVVDTQELSKVADLQVGPKPVAVDISAENQAIYVAGEAGSITVIDGETLQVADTITTKAGLADLRFSRDGRWGFVANPEREQVLIFDAATHQLLYELPVKGRPDQITFSPTAAYIRTPSLPAVILIPLADLGGEGNISVLTVPMGQVAAGEYAGQASAVSATPEEGAMVIANPGDDQVYYYLEGSQASMGSFQGHGLRPRAVKVLDRSLHETAPGVYQGGIRFPKSGDYDVAFLLDSPKVVHCFKITVKPNPELAEKLQVAAPPEFEVLTELQPFKAGETFTLQFALTDGQSQEPIDNLADLYALANQTAGNWNQTYVAKALGEGVYELEISLPRPGLYNVFFAIPSLQARFNQLPNIYLKAVAEEEAAAQ